MEGRVSGNCPLKLIFYTVKTSEHVRTPFDSTPTWESKSEDSTYRVSPQKMGIVLRGHFRGLYVLKSKS